MRKLIIGLGVLAIVLIGGFLFLLSGTSPDDANSQPVSVTLEDDFER